LDYEARVLDFSDHSAGMKKSPMEIFLQISRKLDAHTLIPLGATNATYPFDTATGDYSSPDLYLTNFGYPQAVVDTMRMNQRNVMGSTFFSDTSGIQMEPFRQPTVFNWYLSDYAPTGGVSNAGLVAPEMQLANEQDVIKNINFFFDLVQDSKGISGNNIASNSDAHVLAFNGDDTTTSHDNLRMDYNVMTDLYYPTVAPTPTATETSEYLANLELLNKLDLIFTYGTLAARYPIDASDDGVDGIAQNPREIILDAITHPGDNDPFDGDSDAEDRFFRIRDALYLIISSPDFQIRL